MRRLVFSDVHGNFRALQYLLSMVQSKCHLQTNEYRCLGDLFGYLPTPLEVWKEVLRIDPDARLGNHDIFHRRMLLDERKHLDAGQRLGLTSAESENAAWTALLHCMQFSSASEPTRELIQAHLQRTDVVEPRIEYCPEEHYTYIYAHGSPAQENHPDRQYETWYLPPYNLPNHYRDIDTAMSVAQHLALARGANQDERVILFVGHTHMPMIAYYDECGEVRFHGGNWTNDSTDAPISVNRLFVHKNVIAVSGGAVGYTRTPGALACHTNAVLFDSTNHDLRMITLMLPNRMIDRITNDLSDWNIKDTIPHIKNSLHKYYETKAQTQPYNRNLYEQMV